MHADEVLADALRVDVLAQIRRLDKRLKRAARGTVGGIHDTRTLCRRIETYLDVMGRSVFRRRQAARLSARVRVIERRLAKTRDLDVMIGDLNGYTRLHPRAAGGLRQVEKYLARKRRRAAVEARAYIGRSVRRRLVSDLERVLKHGRQLPRRNGAPAQPFLVRHFTHELIWHRYDALRAFEPSLIRNEKTLHQFRSACRQLRFSIELFGGALRDMSPIVSELIAVQEQIGEMHDHHVAVSRLRRWAARGAFVGTPELDTYVSQRAAARERLKARFEQRWLAQLGTAFRLRLAGAIESEVPAAA
jgi:CHAD domain-containing protein